MEEGGVGGTAADWKDCAERGEAARGVCSIPAGKLEGPGVGVGVLIAWLVDWLASEGGGGDPSLLDGDSVGLRLDSAMEEVIGAGEVFSIDRVERSVEMAAISWLNHPGMSSVGAAVVLAASLASLLFFISSRDDAKKPDLRGADVPEPSSSCARSQPFLNLSAAKH